MEKLLYHHGPTHKNIMKLYSESNVTIKEKVLTYLINMALNSNNEIFASSLYIAESCDIVPSGFKRKFYRAKNRGELTDDMIRLKSYAEATINKAIYELNTKYNLIETNQTFINSHGSRRTIQLNKQQIDQILGTFDMNISTWSFGDRVISIDDHRGFFIVIRKFIRNRIFSLRERVLAKRSEFNKFIREQIARSVINRELLFGTVGNNDAEEIIDMLEDTIGRRLTSNEMQWVDDSTFGYDQWKIALLKAYKADKADNIKYILAIAANDIHPTKDMSYFDKFLQPSPSV